MEYDDDTSMPLFNEELYALYQQVDEQSGLCDVTIQVGQWKKKYHWCVLVKSPFFECIARSDFKEKHTGLVKLDFATPEATEAAIMFLYGERPNLTKDNVDAVLELAEFLLMPNLKSKCVAFLENVPITTENCLKRLHMFSLYGFEIAKCYHYIRANLPEILRKVEAVSLTKESVLTLLTEPLLSYLLAEEKFEFAIRWAKASKLNRDAFEDVFKAIDIESMGEEFLKAVRQDPLVLEMRIAIPDLHVRMPNGDHRALIFPKLLKYNKTVGFDIESERWSRIIEADLLEGPSTDLTFRNAPVLSTRNPREVYRVANRTNGCKVYLQDLHLKESTIKTVSISDDTESGKGISTYDLSRDMFVAISNERTEILRSTTINKRIVRRLVDVDTATVYCGRLQHQDTRIYPIFTIRNTDVAAVCINDQKVIALLSMKKDILHIYDISSGQFVTIALKDHVGVGSCYGLRVAPKEDGFVVYNSKTILDISRLNGQDLIERYTVQTTQLENDRNGNRSIYIYSNSIWFRILMRKGSPNAEFSRVNHGTLMTVSPKEVVWTQLPSPPEDIEILERHDAFIVELPKSMLRCHFDCPHCPQPEKPREEPLEERLQKLSLAETNANFLTKKQRVERLQKLSLAKTNAKMQLRQRLQRRRRQCFRADLYSDEEDGILDLEDYCYLDDYHDDYYYDDYYDNVRYDRYM